MICDNLRIIKGNVAEYNTFPVFSPSNEKKYFLSGRYRDQREQIIIYTCLEECELQSLLIKEKKNACELLINAALNQNSQDDMSVVQVGIFK